jgi:hypothetical protein
MDSKVFLLVFTLHGIHAPQSYVHISQSGTEFIPLDGSVRPLDTLIVLTYQACFYACHQTDLCRVFDYDALLHRCRLFEGDLITTGSIGLSNSPTSSAGHLHLMPFLFSDYGRPCHECIRSRYLKCINSRCECPERTYWTGSICASQQLYAGKCSNDDQCRADLNHTCLQFFQCGRK